MPFSLRQLFPEAGPPRETAFEGSADTQRMTLKVPTKLSITANSGKIQRRLWLLTKPIEADTLNSIKNGSVSLKVFARHQGWVSFPDRGTWSWFELAVICKDVTINQISGSNAYEHVKSVIVGEQGNPLAWRIVHVPVENDGTYQEYRGSFKWPDLRMFRDNMEVGDRLAVFGCAQYPGWSCYGRRVELEINGGVAKEDGAPAGSSSAPAKA